jgi:hypothetical protein
MVNLCSRFGKVLAGVTAAISHRLTLCMVTLDSEEKKSYV